MSGPALRGVVLKGEGGRCGTTVLEESGAGAGVEYQGQKSASRW